MTLEVWLEAQICLTSSGHGADTENPVRYIARQNLRCQRLGKSVCQNTPTGVGFSDFPFLQKAMQWSHQGLHVNGPDTPLRLRSRMTGLLRQD